ncbi:MAG: DUF1924 domain-containing protein [Rhodocyclaceae bacterium]|jgi:hypothetical protein|nr:DUF1924 domain-containing protein [Rhodocyclaceae bacterium]MCO5095927.1 DUF1924 domain-containing protein [Rhodocyclaceae bacterium]
MNMPRAEAARFTDAAKIEKWFRRNCSEVVGHECTAAERLKCGESGEAISGQRRFAAVLLIGWAVAAAWWLVR